MAKGHKKSTSRRIAVRRNMPASSMVAASDADLTAAPNEQQTTINNYWMADSTTIVSDAASDDDEIDAKPPVSDWAYIFLQALGGHLVTARASFLVSLIGWLWVCSRLFLFENEAGRLETYNGYIAYFNKAGVISLFFVAAFIILIIFSRVLKKSNKQKEDN